MSHYEQISFIGLGLIGSSLARAVGKFKLADKIVGYDENADTRKLAAELEIVGEVRDDLASAVQGADLIILATPIGAFGEIGAAIAPHLKKGATISDVGSVKKSVIEALTPHIPDGCHLIPGHPVAGTEESGPRAGFASLFKDRWVILTPPEGTDEDAVEKLSAFWRDVGSKVEIMEASHHDKVLAITSHVPHLIAYNIVGTARDLEEVTKSEVIKFSAGGFRDFTRIAASDPTMWRDVFLNNKEAVLEMLGRFNEDLTALQRAIRWGEADTLYELFDKTRRIRRQIIDAGQDEAEPDFGRSHKEDP